MYSFFMPSVNLMGAGSVAEVGKQAKILGGSKALVVTDKPLMSTGIVEKVTQLLKSSKIDSVIYDGVQPNPTVKNVEEGIDIYKNEKCDVIIAVGGGSAIDCEIMKVWICRENQCLLLLQSTPLPEQQVK